MRVPSIVFAAAFLGLTTTAAPAADKDHKLVCAVVDIHICETEMSCDEAKPSAINAPDFLKIDLSTNEIRGRRHGTGPPCWPDEPMAP